MVEIWYIYATADLRWQCGLSNRHTHTWMACLAAEYVCIKQQSMVVGDCLLCFYPPHPLPFLLSALHRRTLKCCCVCVACVRNGENYGNFCDKSVVHFSVLRFHRYHHHLVRTTTKRFFSTQNRIIFQVQFGSKHLSMQHFFLGIFVFATGLALLFGVRRIWCVFANYCN